MMPTDRFERQLPGLLTELAEPQTPDYFDDLLGQTARLRQRPAWTLLERWLPMFDVARQPVLAPRLTLRTIGLGLLIAAMLLAALAAIVIGTRPRVPAPFGPARNGLIAYAKDGDIFAADPLTGNTVPILSGREFDAGPRHSLDGTQIVFQRGGAGDVRLAVARADGRDVRVLTPAPVFELGEYAFSPDGSTVVFDAIRDGRRAISMARSDGSGVRAIDVGMAASEAAFRPPNGDEIAFIGTADGSASGLYSVRTDGSGLTTLVAPSNLVMARPTWSPDGSSVAYSAYGVDLDVGGLVRVHVFSMKNRTDRVIAPAEGVDWEAMPSWSNDGTRLVIGRCWSIPDNPADCQMSWAVIPADGSNPGVDVDRGRTFSGVGETSQLWAPDDTSILTTPLNELGAPLAGSLLWDPATGVSRPAPWTAPGAASWQRLAP